MFNDHCKPAFVGVVVVVSFVGACKKLWQDDGFFNFSNYRVGVGVFQSVLDMTMVPYLADQYAAGSEVVKEVIIAIGVANPAIYIASLGLPGMWFIFCECDGI